jgi:holin-like protein
MLAQLGVIMVFQLSGEAIVTATRIAFPGPLCGMGLLLLYLYVRGGPSEELSTVASMLIDNLGLLFVPAGTAIIAYGTLLASEAFTIVTALIVSTLAAIFVSGAISSARPVSAPDTIGSMP